MLAATKRNVSLFSPDLYYTRHSNSVVHIRIVHTILIHLLIANAKCLLTEYC